MDDFIVDIRRILGPPPRSQDTDVARGLSRPSPPAWMTSEDEISRLFTEHDRLVEHGDVAVGTIYMANVSIFEPGDNDAPAGLVYSFDQYLQRQPEILSDIGSRLYSYHAGEQEPPKGPLPTNAWFRSTLDAVVHGMQRPFGRLLPPLLSDDHVVYFGTTMIHRDHIPNRRWSRRPFPVLAARDPAVAATPMIVPERFWPKSLRTIWISESESG